MRSKVFLGTMLCIIVTLPLVLHAGGGYSQGSYTGVLITTGARIVGNASVASSISKGAGSFVIDHPLDPKNSLLYHSFVESPDAKNLYDGTATLDENGYAAISLPLYFLALNKDFRYLASPIDEPMPNLHLAEGAHRKWRFGRPIFEIAGGTPGGKISWQVTGIRKDPLILEHPIIPEVDKGPDARLDVGECIFEPLCQR
jgi:hypothetical protein